MKIEIIPVGSLDVAILQYLRRVVSERLNAEVKVGARIPIENFSKNMLRNQYLSTSILNALSGMKGSDEVVLLGVADVDLYVPSLNFVFGEADQANGVAVISIARLRPSFYGLQGEDGLILKRAGKEAVHELGHVFGWGHCVHPKCVMFFSNILTDTDLKDDRFCSECRKSLEY